MKARETPMRYFRVIPSHLDCVSTDSHDALYENVIPEKTPAAANALDRVKNDDVAGGRRPGERHQPGAV